MFELNKSEIGPSGSRIAIAIGGIGLFGALFLSGKLFWILWIGLLAALFARYLIQERQRTGLIREFASRTGFLFLHDCLPKSFPIQDTSSRGAHSINRVFAGDISNKEVLEFDCRLGHGKRQLNRTVVALRGKSSDFGWVRFGPDLETEEVGRWALVYGTRRLLGLDEIARLIAEL
jgi:hypothetical protein